MINRSHRLKRFATVSAEHSVHTGNSHAVSLQQAYEREPKHRQFGHTLRRTVHEVTVQNRNYILYKQNKIKKMKRESDFN
jgi:hypothetical protein